MCSLMHLGRFRNEMHRVYNILFDYGQKLHVLAEKHGITQGVQNSWYIFQRIVLLQSWMDTFE